MIKKILPYSKKYGIYGILAALFITIEVALEVRIPFLLSKIINSGILERDFETVKSLGLQMILMATASLVSGALSARFSATFGMGFGSECRTALFDKIQDFAFFNIDKFGTASLITRCTVDVNMLQQAFMIATRTFVRAPLMFVMAVIYAININAKLSTVFLIVGPIMFASVILIGKASYPRFLRMLDAYDGFNSFIQENLISIRVIKAFVRVKHEKERFTIRNDELRDASVYAERLSILQGPIVTISMYFCVTVILYFGSHFILGGTMEIGDLSAIISYVSQILTSLMMVSMILVMSIMAKASLRRVCAILDEEPAINDDGADETLTVENGSVKMRNVYFKYDLDGEKNVLDNINLSIESGETVGIIGGTGSAKSTLVQLIPRLYDTVSGEILVGGRPIKDYTLKNLRDGVAMVLQNNVLFSGTIKENLLWGDENASDEEIRKACDTAQALNFIESFPDGFDTELGQGGVNVSGGQKQRLTIARALLKKPKILILDDSTSAVDTVTDKSIRDALKKETDTTKIIITQRIASVIDADKIIILDDGKINAIGTHEELLDTSEIYRDVYISQQEGGIDNGAA